MPPFKEDILSTSLQFWAMTTLQVRHCLPVPRDPLETIRHIHTDLNGKHGPSRFLLMSAIYVEHVEAYVWVLLVVSRPTIPTKTDAVRCHCTDNHDAQALCGLVAIELAGSC